MHLVVDAGKRRYQLGLVLLKGSDPAGTCGNSGFRVLGFGLGVEVRMHVEGLITKGHSSSNVLGRVGRVWGLGFGVADCRPRPFGLRVQDFEFRV